jgi:hypothetical protein
MFRVPRSDHGSPSLFAADAWSVLLSEFIEGELVTHEASALLDALALSILSEVVRHATEAAQRRGSAAVEREDVQFAYETVLLSARSLSPRARRTPSRADRTREAV